MTDPARQYLTDLEMRMMYEIVSGNEYRCAADARIAALTQELERRRPDAAASDPTADIGGGYVSRASSAPVAPPVPEGAMQPDGPPPSAQPIPMGDAP